MQPGNTDEQELTETIVVLWLDLKSMINKHPMQQPVIEKS
jgi:hypothetical protein